jgi:acyl dehydratase/NAD(P)-dependent dehydrogenase (short-subunit alcohol dehydrogenase family)
MTETPLASRLFTMEDQARFAALTYDSNPVHVDALAARRTQFGQPIVHGVHGVLWAIDAAAQQGIPLKQYRGLQAHFRKPVLLGETVHAFATPTGKNLSIEIRVDGLIATKITLSPEPPRNLDAAVAPGSGAQKTMRSTAADLTLEEMAQCRGAIAYAAPDMAPAFPGAAREFGAEVLHGLAASTYVVGMECPGLHSIYSRLMADLGARNDGGVAFATTMTDDRARVVQLSMRSAGVTARIDAFARRPPVAGPTMDDAARVVRTGEFAGQRALVIGGSRGLGAAIAKIVTAGGGAATITYARGAAEAAQVVAEIEAAGGRCDMRPYQALEPALDQLPDALEVNAVYYFATSPIGRRKTRAFDAALLHEFVRFHVDGFADLAEAMRERIKGRLVLFYPSSTYAAETPKELGEYGAAKRAAEAIAENLGRVLPDVAIVVERLPPIDTDQNASVTSAPTASALDAMAPIARKVQAALEPPRQG